MNFEFNFVSLVEVHGGQCTVIRKGEKTKYIAANSITIIHKVGERSNRCYKIVSFLFFIESYTTKVRKLFFYTANRREENDHKWREFLF